MTTPVEDIEFLARSGHRVNALGALAAGPQSRDDLRVVIDASNATVGRLLNEFDNRTWIQRDGLRYELTPLGEFIASGFFDLVERFETERSIRGIWQWFPIDLGFTIEMFSGATITLQDARDPHCPNIRYAELIETSESLREVGTVPHKPKNVRMVLERAVAGMEVELVFPREVMTYMIGFTPELANEALKSGNLVLLVHDDLPGGFWIFDERVGTCCRDDETGLSRAVIDTSTGLGARNYWKTHYLVEMSEEAISVVCNRATDIASPETAIGMMALGREIARRPADSTPYQHRDAEWFVVIQARWREAEEDETHTGWARGLFEDLAPHATGGVYLNATSPDEDEAGVYDALGTETYERLATIKAQWDPENLFHLNPNVPPAT